LILLQSLCLLFVPPFFLCAFNFCCFLSLTTTTTLALFLFLFKILTHDIIFSLSCTRVVTCPAKPVRTGAGQDRLIY
jgi:hypothetical protein